MKGTRIEKWKDAGIKDFIMKTLCNQVARNTIKGTPNDKLKIPLEALHIIIGLSGQTGNIDNIIILGKNIEVY